MKPDEAVTVVRKFLKECPGIWVQGPHPQIIEAVHALLEGFEAALEIRDRIASGRAKIAALHAEWQKKWGIYEGRPRRGIVTESEPCEEYRREFALLRQAERAILQDIPTWDDLISALSNKQDC